MMAYRIINRKLIASKYDFMVFSISSATEGIEYKVRAPKNMQVLSLVHNFVVHLSKGPAKDNVKFISFYFDPIFQLKTNKGFIDIDPDKTLFEAGIRHNSKCQISARKKTEDFEIKYRFM